GEAIAVQVVADHEARGQLRAFADARAALLAGAVAGESAAGERVLVPGAVGPLLIEQPADTAVRGWTVGAPGSDEPEQRPGRLGGGALAAATGVEVDVRGAGLAPPAVAVLPILEPAPGAADGEAVHRLAHGP